MKSGIKQLVLPKRQYFNYRNYDLNFIQMKPRAISKGYILLDKTKPHIRKLKRKPPIPKQSFELDFQRHNNKNSNGMKSQISLYKKSSIDNNFIFSSPRSNYYMTMMEKKSNEKQFEETMQFLCDKIDIQPSIQHFHFHSPTKKRFNSALLPKESNERNIKTWFSIPSLFRNSAFTPQMKQSASCGDLNGDHNGNGNEYRYAKPRINIDAIIQNYNSNAKKSFSRKKVKMYQIKVSPFLFKDSMRNSL